MGRATISFVLSALLTKEFISTYISISKSICISIFIFYQSVSKAGKSNNFICFADQRSRSCWHRNHILLVCFEISFADHWTYSVCSEAELLLWSPKQEQKIALQISFGSICIVKIIKKNNTANTLIFCSSSLKSICTNKR